MADKIQKKKNKTNSKQPDAFLFSGYLVAGKPEGKLNPIQNSLILTQDPKKVSAEDLKKGKALYLATDSKGALNHFSQEIANDFRLRQPFKTIKKPKQSETNELTVIIPPTDLVCLHALLEKDWLEKLNKAMQQIELKSGNNFPTAKLHKVKKTQFRKPRIDMVNHEVDKEYRGWYNRLNDKQEINTYILPKTRAIFFLFSMPIINLENTKLELIIPGKTGKVDVKIISAEDLLKESEQKNTSEEKSAQYIATYTGTDKKLPKGVYTFTVSKPDLSVNLWSEKVTGNKERKIEGDNSYSLSVYVDFEIENHAGEFSIINADPISIEESLINQHPKYYSHLTQAAMLEAYPAHAKGETKKKAKPPSSGLKAISDQWNNTKSTIELGHKSLGCQNKTPLLMILSQALHEKFRGSEHKKLAEAVDLFFDVTATARAWSDMRKSAFDLFKEITGTETTSFAKATKQVFATNRKELFKISKSGVKKQFFCKSAWAQTDDYLKTFAGKLGIPQKGFSFLGKAMSAADIIYSGVSIANAYIDCSKASNDLKFAVEELSELSQQYLDLVGEKKRIIQTELRTEFDFDKTDIKPEFEEHLRKEILNVLVRYPHKKIILEGHTDSVGTIQYNKDLSERRAKAIKDWLTANGIAENRIKAVGHGESKEEASNDTKEGRKRNRRVVATIKTDDSYNGAPCRIGINNLERFRSISVEKQLKSDAAIIELGEKILDFTLAILSVIPVTAPAAIAISLAKATIKTAADADKFFTGGEIAKLLDDEKIYGELVLESLANQTLLRNLPFDDEKLIKKEDAIAHFRIRAEAIAGLMRLIIRAALSVDKENTLEDRIKKYEIQAYIQNFILNDKWFYPLRTPLPLGMDEFWLFATNIHNLDHDKAREGFGFDNVFRLVTANAAIQSQIKDMETFMQKINPKRNMSEFSCMMSMIDFDLPGHIKTDFQNKFPVHFLASEKVLELAKEFNPSFSNLDDKSYEFTGIYYQPFKPKNKSESKKWYSFAHKSVDLNSQVNKLYSIERTWYGKIYIQLNTSFTISPLDKIKIVLVFKDGGENKVDRITPVKLQLFRRDGLDAEGPAYKSLARPLVEEDFDGITHMSKSQKQKFIGKYGCVITPFFQLGAATFHGTKPLATSVSFWGDADADEYYRDGGLTNMRYGFECVIGNNSDTKIDVPLITKEYWDKYKNFDPHKFATEYKINFNIEKNPEENLFLIESFLKSNSKKIEQPLLFDGQIRAVSWMRLGGEKDQKAPYIPKVLTNDIKSYYSNKGIKLKKDGVHLEINNFNWKTSVEFVFFIICTKLHKADYKKAKVNWRNIAGTIQLWEDGDSTDSNLDGPKLNLNYNYIGEISQDSNNKLSLSKEVADRDLHPISEKLHSCIKDKGDFLNLFDIPAGGHTGRANFRNDFYIYAAHAKMEYTSPVGIKVKSIRPFGDGKIDSNGNPDDSYFEYGFKNITTASESGNELKRTFGDVQIYNQYHFSAPKDFVIGAPWIEEGSVVSTGKYMSKERLKKWLEKESTAIQPSKNDVKKNNAGKKS